jgi:hypothetical protein
LRSRGREPGAAGVGDAPGEFGWHGPVVAGGDLASGYYRQMRDRFTTLVQRYQHDGALDREVSAHHIAQVLTAMGPAFLFQRAVLNDVSVDTFTHGLCGLLDGRPTVET